jgi:restriction system protein
MPIPDIQTLLLPVLKMIADRRSIEETRKSLKETFQVSPAEAKQKYPKGQNVYVNTVAFALNHLVQGKAIVRIQEGSYEITERGREILKANPSELTIRGLH